MGFELLDPLNLEETGTCKRPQEYGEKKQNGAYTNIGDHLDCAVSRDGVRYRCGKKKKRENNGC